MWTLTIETDEGGARDVKLDRDGYSLGRDKACDLCIPERNVSRRHARLERDGDGRWWLVDLGATYGNFVNGVRIVERAALSAGDTIQVGDCWLGLRADERGADASPAVVRQPSPAPWDVRDEPDHVLVFDGPDDGGRVPLDGRKVLIGLGAGIDIRLPDGVAPEGAHALLRPLPEGRYEFVRRTDALNLRVRLQPVESVILEDEDLVRFETPGGVEVMAMRFCAARRVRHSTLMAVAEGGSQAWRGPLRGRRIDPAALPQLEAIEASLRALPLWWRLEGESLWPRPAGYRSPPVKFTDVSNEQISTPAGTSASLAGRDQGRRPRALLWASVAAAVALLGGTWGLVAGPNSDDATGAAGPWLGASMGGPYVSSAAPLAASAVAPGSSAAGGAGERTSASAVVAAAAGSSPTPGRASTLAARPASTPPRFAGSTRRSDPAEQSEATPDERGGLRGLCRSYATKIARGEASPEIVQFHRARCQ